MFSNKFPFIGGQFLSLDWVLFASLCSAWKSFSFEFAQLFQLALLQNVNMLFIPVSQIFPVSACVFSVCVCWSVRVCVCYCLFDAGLNLSLFVCLLSPYQNISRL